MEAFWASLSSWFPKSESSTNANSKDKSTLLKPIRSKRFVKVCIDDEKTDLTFSASFVAFCHKAARIKPITLLLQQNSTENLNLLPTLSLELTTTNCQQSNQYKNGGFAFQFGVIGIRKVDPDTKTTNSFSLSQAIADQLQQYGYSNVISLTTTNDPIDEAKIELDKWINVKKNQCRLIQEMVERDHRSCVALQHFRSKFEYKSDLPPSLQSFFAGATIHEPIFMQFLNTTLSQIEENKCSIYKNGQWITLYQKNKNVKNKIDESKINSKKYILQQGDHVTLRYNSKNDTIAFYKNGKILINDKTESQSFMSNGRIKLDSENYFYIYGISAIGCQCGSDHNVIPEKSTRGGNMTFTISCGKFGWDWERILWIGYFKNSNNSLCLIKTLPKVILQLILSFV